MTYTVRYRAKYHARRIPPALRTHRQRRLAADTERNIMRGDSRPPRHETAAGLAGLVRNDSMVSILRIFLAVWDILRYNAK